MMRYDHEEESLLSIAFAWFVLGAVFMIFAMIKMSAGKDISNIENIILQPAQQLESHHHKLDSK